MCPIYVMIDIGLIPDLLKLPTTCLLLLFIGFQKHKDISYGSNARRQWLENQQLHPVTMGITESK